MRRGEALSAGKTVEALQHAEGTSRLVRFRVWQATPTNTHGGLGVGSPFLTQPYWVGNTTCTPIPMHVQGASRQVIDLLPTVVVRPGGRQRTADDERGTCSICLEDVKDGSVMRLLPCAHRFHKDW